jgi:hypothetical protein
MKVRAHFRLIAMPCCEAILCWVNPRLPNYLDGVLSRALMPQFVMRVGCPHLAWRLSGPALACMRECAHLMKTEQPRNVGYMQLAVIEVTYRQIVPQLLKYFSEVQAFVRKPSRKRPLAHSQTASDVLHEHPSMRKQRRDRVFNSGAQLAHITFSIG